MKIEKYLKEQLSTDSELAKTALLTIYNNQSVDEQFSQTTTHKNNIGFNAMDANFASSLAKQLIERGTLSEKQMGYVFKIVPKYWKQLANFIGLSSKDDVEKFKNQKNEEAEKINEETKTVREKIQDDAFALSAMYMLCENNLLKPQSRDFVKSLYSQHKRRGTLSVKQMDALKSNLKSHTKEIILNNDLLKPVKAVKIEKPISNTSKVEDVSISPKNIKVELYDFQKKGLGFLIQKNGNGLIADDMGLGKTIQAISYLAENPDKRPALIVVPASLKINWFREIEKFMKNRPSVEVLSGTRTHKLSSEIIIINYDIIKHWEKVLVGYNFKVMILDEAHKIKNVKAQRSKAVKRISKNIPHRIALTGTPIMNRPIELYNILDYITPGTFKFWGFAQRYCGARQGRWGWDFSGATNKKELHEKINNIFMIRRRKDDVLKQLPSKQKTVIPFILENIKDYEFAEAEFIEWLRNRKGNKVADKAQNAEALVKIEYLKQLSVKGKIKQSINWIKDFLESDEKLVVFATHTETLDILQKEFPQCVRIDGSTSTKGRDEAVQKFQNDKNCNIIIGNINAMGVGLTLTASSSVLFLEFPWTPADLQQAEDRVHRIGQESESVNIYYAVGCNTIDEKIIKLLEEKQETINAIIDGKTTKAQSLLGALLNDLE